MHSSHRPAGVVLTAADDVAGSPAAADDVAGSPPTPAGAATPAGRSVGSPTVDHACGRS